MNIKMIIDEFKEEIKKIYGNRLEEVILYGSWARGTSTGDSDIDLMVVLKGEVTPGREKVFCLLLVNILVVYNRL